MSIQNQRIFSQTIASVTSKSTGVDLSGGYLYVSILVPASGTNKAFSVSAGSPIYVLGSNDGVTYYRTYEFYSNTVSTAFSIQSSVCAALVPIPYFNYRYIQLECSGTVTGAATGGVSYKIICTDSL